MRSLIFVVTFLFCSAATITYPFAGLLTWEWFTLAAPHNMIWGSAASIQYNLYLALLTIGVWLFSSEPKMLPNDKLSWTLVLFTLWIAVAEYFSYNHDYSYEYFDRFIRVMLFILLLNIMVTDKVRIHAVVWLMVIAVGLYAAKGGVFTVLSGGGYRVWGPEKTMIADNNSFGLAAVFLIPFVMYLYKYTEQQYIKWALAALVLCCVAAALGTQSRGAFISLAALGVYGWWRSRNKIIMLIALFFLSGPLLLFMPESWYERMSTIGEATSDESFMSRVELWKASFNAALDNPLTGVGLRSLYHADIATQYGGGTFGPYKAIHSIYFEIMAGMGFVGFILYISLFFITWLMANKVKRHCIKNGDTWMADLAVTCTVALVAFMVGGAALSSEMWEGYLIAMTIVGALHRLAFRDVRQHEAEASRVRLSPMVSTNDGPEKFNQKMRNLQR